MWIFRNDAMLSVVENRDDPNILLVRARQLGDIEQVFPDADVFSMIGSDYKYRAWIDRETVAKAMYASVMTIDYDNFKNSIRKGDYARKRAYMDVWQAMYDYQRGEDRERFY